MPTRSFIEEFAKETETALQNLLSRANKSTAHKKLTNYRKYLDFLNQQFPDFHIDNLQQSFVEFRSDMYLNRNGNQYQTVHSYYSMWKAAIEALMQIGAIPKCPIPKPMGSRNELLFSPSRIKVLGYLNPQLWKEQIRDLSFLEAQALNSDQYLEHFIDSQRHYKALLLDLARGYISEASKRFYYGQELIRSNPTNKFAEENQLYLYDRKSGRKMGKFSDRLPDSQGLENLLLFLWHNRRGLVNRDFPGANNHLYRFNGRTHLQEHLGMSSNLAAACAVVIIFETGINSESLYNLKYDASRNIIERHDYLDGFYLNYEKPRAKGPINRLIKSDTSYINAEFCLNLVNKMTAHYRSLSSKEHSKYFFLHDGVFKLGTVSNISSTAFKQGLKRLVACSGNDDLILSKVNYSKMRVTGGILAWYESGGDARAAARFLGNSTEVSIKHYLPIEIQSIFYTKQIREFQHLKIAIATFKKDYQMAALNVDSPEELKEYLETNVIQNELYKRFKNLSNVPKKDITSKHKITFVISKANIAYLFCARKEYTSNPEENNALAKWSDICNLLFQYIRNHGSRHHKILLAEGVELAQNKPNFVGTNYGF